MLRLTDCSPLMTIPPMTIVVDWDVTQQNKQTNNGINRRSYMSYVLLDLLNELLKRDKMQGLFFAMG